ncbi:MAG: hypothetical protein PHC64_00290 [Candidatus Gastranaerophilales bacterium]|nr:hypothetical protein [Candidatus Gastranaerophilales bacterium]
MKKIICLMALFLMFNLPAFSTELEGGVTFNVDSAREYVQEGQKDNIDISGPIKLETDNIEKIVYSKNTLGEIIGITVQYKGEPDRAYIYDKNKNLIYFEKYDKPVSIYPHRGYRYNLKGQLVLTSLTVSKDEMFRFNPQGKLIVHSINGVIYDENGQIIGRGIEGKR